ncbi:hypothetical protein B0H14DRAFT_2710712 [Mycena olivaceomarginata]|nr:hypothetical protein B0H14DRAFT_2710712 [Mycena olivaceomarginata]
MPARRCWHLQRTQSKKTEALITNRAGLALSSEGKKALDEFESTLELIRRHIESIPERGNKPSKVKFGLSALAFRHESARLKAQLDRVYQSLTSNVRTRARNEYILEVATVGTRVAGAVCEIPLPGLNFLKPVVGLAVLICDTAKTVDGNRTAAVALASHAQEVTHSIVERAEKEPHGNNNAASVDNLRLTLEEIQAFLERLKSRRRTTAWLMAVKDKDRFVELNGALDRALAVFCGSQSIAMTASVRESAQELATIAATVNRVEEGVTRTIPASVQENTQQLASRCGHRNRQELATLVATANRVEEGVKRMITLSVQFQPINLQSHFFFLLFRR